MGDTGSIPGSGRAPGEGNGKSFQYSYLESPMNSMKRQKDMTLKDKLHRSVGVQCATGEEWRNKSRKNEEMEPKQKTKQNKTKHPVVDVTGDGIGTRNVKAKNQSKLQVVKQEMARVNTDILGIYELEWANLTQMTIIHTTVGKNPLEEME